MVACFDAERVSLHARVTNYAAIHLYSKTLGFKYNSPSRISDQIVARIHQREAKYYADQEDAFDMRKSLQIKESVASP